MVIKDNKYWMLFQKTMEDVKTLTIDQLETLILDLQNRKIETAYSVKVKLEAYLTERQDKINQAFEWTSENIEKLLSLDQKMMACFEKLYDEAKPLVSSLQQRIENQDSFLCDFEIEASVTPFIMVSNEKGDLIEAEDGIERVLMDDLDNAILSCSFRMFGDKHDILYLDKEQNWCNHGIFKDHFKEKHVSQAVHDLYDHTLWSMIDILKINELWAELKVRHQHFTEV